MPMPQLPPGFNRDKIHGDLEKSLKTVTKRYRFFAIGFLVGVASIAATLYFIHPALSATVGAVYLTYFMRVNLLGLDDNRTQLRNGLAALDLMPKAEDIKPKETHYGTHL